MPQWAKRGVRSINSALYIWTLIKVKYQWHFGGCQIIGGYHLHRPKRRPGIWYPVVKKCRKRNPGVPLYQTVSFYWSRPILNSIITWKQSLHENINLIITNVWVSWMKTFLSLAPLKIRLLSGEKAANRIFPLCAASPYRWRCLIVFVTTLV